MQLGERLSLISSAVTYSRPEVIIAVYKKRLHFTNEQIQDLQRGGMLSHMPYLAIGSALAAVVYLLADDDDRSHWL